MGEQGTRIFLNRPYLSILGHFYVSLTHRFFRNIKRTQSNTRNYRSSKFSKNSSTLRMAYLILFISGCLVIVISDALISSGNYKCNYCLRRGNVIFDKYFILNAINVHRLDTSCYTGKISGKYNTVDSDIHSIHGTESPLITNDRDIFIPNVGFPKLCSTSTSSLKFSLKNNVDAPVPCAYVAESNLPTSIGNFCIRAYRVLDTDDINKYVGTEPCVIYNKKKKPFGMDDVSVRIHDQCFTSEVFGSLRCDCKSQLQMSLNYIQQHGGAVIYLQQEGRGIGLANKVASYALQDRGVDTVDANLHLGFLDDCRQYGMVPSILKDMEIFSIRLMTNNPFKVRRLLSLGVDVVGTLPMVVRSGDINQYNIKYLQTKMDRMNHANFGDMLTGMLRREKVTDNFSFGGSCNCSDSNVSKTFKRGNSLNMNEHNDKSIGEKPSRSLSLHPDGVKVTNGNYCFGRQSVVNAIMAIAKGEIIVVVDDMDRENEGDFIMAADAATPERLATIVRYSSGVVCVGMEGSRMDDLLLPNMVKCNEDPKGTAFSVSVDGGIMHGISTGISAKDRAKTLQLLANPSTEPHDIVRPGHIFPLRAKKGGVLMRCGHTEASVDICRLAGRTPCGVLCEIVSENNPVEMMRLLELKTFCLKNGFLITSIADISQYRRELENHE